MKCYYVFQVLFPFQDWWVVPAKVVFDQTVWAAVWNSIYYVLLGFLHCKSPANILGKMKATFWPMLTVRNVPSLFSTIFFSNCHAGSFNWTWALHVGTHDTSNWEWILMFHVLEVPKFVDHRKWCCDLFIFIFFNLHFQTPLYNGYTKHQHSLLMFRVLGNSLFPNLGN